MGRPSLPFFAFCAIAPKALYSLCRELYCLEAAKAVLLAAASNKKNKYALKEANSYASRKISARAAGHK